MLFSNWSILMSLLCLVNNKSVKCEFNSVVDSLQYLGTKFNNGSFLNNQVFLHDGTVDQDIYFCSESWIYRNNFFYCMLLRLTLLLRFFLVWFNLHAEDDMRESLVAWTFISVQYIYFHTYTIYKVLRS